MKRGWSSRHATRLSTATWASSTLRRATRRRPSNRTWPCWKRGPTTWRRSATWPSCTAKAGDYDNALLFAQRALELVTKDEDRAALQSLIDQLQAQRGG